MFHRKALMRSKKKKLRKMELINLRAKVMKRRKMVMLKMLKQKRRKKEMQSHLLNHLEFLQPKWTTWEVYHSFKKNRKS